MTTEREAGQPLVCSFYFSPPLKKLLAAAGWLSWFTCCHVFPSPVNIVVHVIHKYFSFDVTRLWWRSVGGGGGGGGQCTTVLLGATDAHGRDRQTDVVVVAWALIVQQTYIREKAQELASGPFGIGWALLSFPHLGRQRGFFFCALACTWLSMQWLSSEQGKGREIREWKGGSRNRPCVPVSFWLLNT